MDDILTGILQWGIAVFIIILVVIVVGAVLLCVCIGCLSYHCCCKSSKQPQTPVVIWPEKWCTVCLKDSSGGKKTRVRINPDSRWSDLFPGLGKTTDPETGSNTEFHNWPGLRTPLLYATKLHGFPLLLCELTQTAIFGVEWSKTKNDSIGVPCYFTT